MESVTELIVAQFLWLDYDDPSKPIHLYINSPGTQVSRFASNLISLNKFSFWNEVR